MNRKTFQFAMWLMWLAVPFTALRFWLAWDRLPQRMATHFNADWRPNGWMPRETALYFTLGMIVFVLIIFTAVAYVSQRASHNGAISWVMLGFFYVVLGFLVAINDKVIQYNLTGEPIHGDWLVAVVPGAVIVFMALYLRLQRGQPLPAASPIAEETHASSFFAFFFLVLTVGSVLSLAVLPAGVRAASLILCGLFFLITASAWSGFQYFFTQYGVEVHTLGYRLRSIPVKSIVSYDQESWNTLRGYGIRGVGRSRAYVWGNRVVRIRTTEGDVILGHNDPARIMQDIDRIRQFAH
ncbi:MAG TPA: DUF1648 domain-containing protein [Terriglobales bacterium]|nr:DUF1648 domain-containing protein [Terriglobales bacterium]